MIDRILLGLIGMAVWWNLVEKADRAKSPIAAGFFLLVGCGCLFISFLQ